MRFNSVQLFQDGDIWAVIVVEDDRKTRREFKFEEHAQNFAHGQRIRLGLPASGQHISNANLNDVGGALSQ